MNMVASVDKAKTVNVVLEPIYKFLYQDGVDEVTINREKEIWVKYGYKWVKHEINLTEREIRQIISALCTFNGLQLAPNLSMILPNGERCQATLAPSVVDGYISFNIRKHSTTIYTLDDLVKQGAFANYRDVSTYKSSEQIEQYKDQLDEADIKLLELKEQGNIEEFLKQIVLLKKNILIAGSTGSGKTTFMRSLVLNIPDDERIITIEDVHELQINQPNHLHLLMGEGKGRLPPQDALKACMRLSPDRILLAEIRGNEAYEFLNSLNTGHSGGMTTVHANNALASFDRVATLIKNSEVGRGLDLESIMMSLNNSLEVILFFKYRKLVEVYFDPIKRIKKNIMS
ncbi:P-type DNA transfer ATPase VirB11 (plasmid) [Acinetobacter pittii]|uniref:P-type DNA transfer ATPase VirB11 n=1 Tax=Acinetobacter TaxID=469 RepID=UPI000E2CA7F8|nr:P-type DNA transfer ATPase VirB11 [Acinetobacter pittii]AZC05419.1 P-type DNA transfer ATPase VirB11 [Acinetobacter nosocomialis]QXA09995.1 P-type DNA transfer ATPase VirB11 [Acinetobacter pittii]